jgi:ketosteroid isomerase-like protein
LRKVAQRYEELIREGYARWNESREIAFELLDPDVEWIVTSLDSAQKLTFRGHDGVQEWFDAILMAWDDVNWELEEVHALGNQVVGVVRMHAVGHHTRIPFDIRGANVWTFRDDLVVRFEVFSDPDDVDALLART